MDPPADPAHAEIAAATRAALPAAVTEPRYTPRRPLLLPQLLRAVNDNDVSRRELAALIVRDPSLTGNLLKLANAPFYRISSAPVENIDRAIALIGTEGIRSLIATAVMQPVFRVAGGEFARFPEVTWEHTFRSGTAAAAHAAIVEHSDPFAAQLLTLLSGLASIIVFRVALDQYAARPAGASRRCGNCAVARCAYRTGRASHGFELGAFRSHSRCLAGSNSPRDAARVKLAGTLAALRAPRRSPRPVTREWRYRCGRGQGDDRRERRCEPADRGHLDAPQRATG